MGFEPDMVGEFVDALLADHGGIHVGEKLLAPRRLRLHHHVDRQLPQRRAQPLGDRGGVVGRGFFAQVKVRSAAMPGLSQMAWHGSGSTMRAPSSTVVSSAGWVGLQMSVATSDMSGAGPEQAKAVLIAGPTASGKSALALRLAETRGGVVINTNSMQVYRDLRVLTARPTPEEEARAPHRLYGTWTRR